MDTSKEYIKMCEQAHEIQEPKKKEGFDPLDHFYTGKGNFKNEPMCFVEDFSYPIYSKDDPNYNKFVWLPRQDQLQELLFNQDRYFNMNPVVIVNNLFGYTKEDQFSPTKSENGLLESKLSLFKTMEQITLSLVMDKKFNKKWNSELKTWQEIAR